MTLGLSRAFPSLQLGDRLKSRPKSHAHPRPDPPVQRIRSIVHFALVPWTNYIMQGLVYPGGDKKG